MCRRGGQLEAFLGHWRAHLRPAHGLAFSQLNSAPDSWCRRGRAAGGVPGPLARAPAPGARPGLLAAQRRAPYGPGRAQAVRLERVPHHRQEDQPAPGPRHGRHLPPVRGVPCTCAPAHSVDVPIASDMCQASLCSAAPMRQRHQQPAGYPAVTWQAACRGFA